MTVREVFLLRYVDERAEELPYEVRAPIVNRGPPGRYASFRGGSLPLAEIVRLVEDDGAFEGRFGIVGPTFYDDYTPYVLFRFSSDQDATLFKLSLS